MYRFNNCYTFGPVPSRRLGNSLGINNIPQKVCSYSCVYCQVGKTTQLEVQPGSFYEPKHIYNSVLSRITSARQHLEEIDYLSFVPDGEPTLDKNLGKVIDLLKPLDIPIAIITNSSLLTNKNTLDTLRKADWVSIKIDSVIETIWKRINQPHLNLNLKNILNHLLSFSKNFTGKLVTETMLVKDFNDDNMGLTQTAQFINELNPLKAYLATPIRPPLGNNVFCPDKEKLEEALSIFVKHLQNVEFMNDFEGNAFAFTGDAKKDLTAITAVHPMRKESIEEFLSKANAGKDLLDEMLKEKILIEIKYNGHLFYKRNFNELKL